jgi:phage replication-related protein YjqB (UPF0714/DUF867 family)
MDLSGFSGRSMVAVASAGLWITTLLVVVEPSSADGPQIASREVRVRDPLPGHEQVSKKKESCSVDSGLLRSIGRKPGEQVRIYRNANDFAVFTVFETLEEANESTVRIGRLGRLRIGPSDEFDGRITPTIPSEGLTETQARERGEMIEHLTDDGTNTGLIIMAPHGGDLETPTDLQAERLAEKLGGNRVSTWVCKAYHIRGGKSAFDRWHITSTDISEASYPLLGKVSTRKFEYAVSFHGMTDQRILIGGSAPTRLRTEIRDAIRQAINDPKIPVDLAMPGDANGGKDPKNIVNRYVNNGGVQIEQSSRARKEHWKAIADALAKVYASKL